MTTLIERDMTVTDVARAIGINRATVRKLMAEGKFPTAYQTDGGQWRVQPSGVARWLEERVR